MNKTLRGITLVLFVFGAALYAALGWRALHPATSNAIPASLSAPVISPQRAPEVVATNVRDQQLRATLKTIASEAGSEVCLDIERDGIDVATWGASKPLTPASTTKLLTASAALDVFDADDTFETKVKAKDPKNGTVDGPLYLVGGGDPLLFTDQYQQSLRGQLDIHSSVEQLADAVVAKGIRVVNGGVNADDRRFDGQRAVPTWEPGYVTQAQVGSIGALTINQGIDVRPNGARSVVQDPALHAASIFTDLLRARGVQVKLGPGFGPAPNNASDIAKLDSRPMSDLVKQMLTESDNTTAEILLKQIAYKKTEQGTTAEGTKTVLEEISAERTTLIDGSGLDRGNRTTCELLTSVLASSGPNGTMSAGLARAGETGTLTTRMRDSPAVGRVQAKTGTLANVSALAGWASTDGSTPLAFSMIVNGIDAQRAEAIENRVAVALASLPPVASSAAYAPR